MKLASIQILRGVAANAVVMAHLSAYERSVAGPDLYFAPWYYGAAGVDLFFVISGFVMVASASGTPTAAFLWRRFARIYPLYWIATLAFLATILAFPGFVGTRGPEDQSILRTVFLVPIWGDNIIPLAWTLIFEVWFYLIFAGLLAMKANLWKAMAVWLGILLVCLIAGSPFDTPLYHLTSFLSAEFMLGMVAGLLWKRGEDRFALPALLAGLLMLTIAVFWLAPSYDIGKLSTYQNWRVLYFGVPSALVVYGAVGLERYAKRLPALLSTLGDISYSTYLLHLIVLFFVANIVRLSPLGGWADNAAIFVVGLVGSNVVAYGAYRLFERPIMRLSRVIELRTKSAIERGLVRLARQ